MLDKTINLHRVGRLLVGDLSNFWLRSVLLLGGLLVASVIIFQVQMGNNSSITQNTEWLMDHWVGASKFHITYFPAALLISGFVFTSLCFSDLIRKPSRHFFLALPASNLEKWGSKWLLSALLFPLLWTILYQCFAFYTYSWFRDKGFEMVHLPLTDPWVWHWFGVYILVQSLFFLGAVWMPRFSLIKTTLFLAATLGLCILLYEFGVYTLLPLISEEINEMATRAASNEYTLGVDAAFQSYLNSQYPFWFKLLFGFFLFPVAMWISYLKLKEKEV